MRLCRVTTAGCCLLSAPWMSSCLCSFNREKISEQSGVQREASEAGQRGRPDDRLVASEICVHRCREQPQLEHHQYQHYAEDAVDDRRLLFASESPTHNTLSSTP